MKILYRTPITLLLSFIFFSGLDMVSIAGFISFLQSSIHTQLLNSKKGKKTANLAVLRREQILKLFNSLLVNDTHFQRIYIYCYGLYILSTVWSSVAHNMQNSSSSVRKIFWQSSGFLTRVSKSFLFKVFE